MTISICSLWESNIRAGKCTIHTILVFHLSTSIDRGFPLVFQGFSHSNSRLGADLGDLLGLEGWLIDIWVLDNMTITILGYTRYITVG